MSRLTVAVAGSGISRKQGTTLFRSQEEIAVANAGGIWFAASRGCKCWYKVLLKEEAWHLLPVLALDAVSRKCH